MAEGGDNRYSISQQRIARRVEGFRVTELKAQVNVNKGSSASRQRACHTV